MTLSIDNHLRTYGAAPSQQFGMPVIPGATQYHASPLDWISESARAIGGLAIPILGAGVLGGALLGRNGGMLRIAGMALAGGVGAAASAIVGAHLIGAARPDASSRIGVPNPIPVTEGPESLRVMTWNIHAGYGGPESSAGGAAQLERLARDIERAHPDVVVMQEVTDYRQANGHIDQTQWLADRLHADSAAFAPAVRYPDGSSQGVAILTFNGATLDSARALQLGDLYGDGTVRRLVQPLGGIVEKLGIDTSHSTLFRPRQPRNALEAMVQTPAGNTVRVIGTHLSGVGPNSGGNMTDSQERQVGGLLPAINAWKGPTVFAGDFNVRAQTVWGQHERDMLASVGMRDAFSAVGIPPDSPDRASFGEGPDVRIDHVYASDQVTVNDTFVDRTDIGASDHNPVITDLSIGPQP